MKGMKDMKRNAMNGRTVRFINRNLHKKNPDCFPKVGTFGTIISSLVEGEFYVHWAEGSTSNDDCWWVEECDIELVAGEETTNEEIWQMLKLKMEKNGIESHPYPLESGEFPDVWYYPEDVHEAIAIAYRSGYERAMKGRPFKFEGKKEEMNED